MKSIIWILLGRTPTTLPVRTVTQLLRDDWYLSLLPDVTTCAPHFLCLSNVLLIYTCWAQGCLGIRYLLTTSITQQALLLPFKIHLKRFAGASVQRGMDAVIVMRFCGECLTVVAWWGTGGSILVKAKASSSIIIIEISCTLLSSLRNIEFTPKTQAHLNSL